jgi:AcrR family transcriptional regulator
MIEQNVLFDPYPTSSPVRLSRGFEQNVRSDTLPLMSNPSDAGISQRRSSAREQLLETASRIFYEEGINSVSVDRIIDAANGTRSTFYRYFPSKEDLVAAYLTTRDMRIRAACELAADHEPNPANLLRLVMGAIGDDLCSPGFRGCPFINAAAEFPDPTSTVHEAAAAHRSWFRELILDLITRAGARDPQKAARALIMLRDGAMVGGYLEDAEATRATLVEAVDSVLAAQTA